MMRQMEDASTVAITIDDAPMPDTTPAMLDLLDRFGAKATFFMSGCRAESAEDVIAETVKRGHAIYAHGWDHVRLDREPTSRLRGDMERCEALLARHRPTPEPYLVRLPYNGGRRSARIHRALAQWRPGCALVHWGPSTEDHMTSTRCTCADDVEVECRKDVDRLLADPRLPGGILLMHDQPINERPGAEFKPAVTITMLRLLLEGLSAQSLRCVTLPPPPPQAWWQRFILV
ncbi:Polysaccharide deacetylase family protein [Paramagnetospirillum magnetotacticum MS-1]|uniref:Chitooligosaccharide deacetylase n=1 Tax=Paramagnetospirillum magnetotacticum MS-1 TaxID=272627 RepID=A0A0C2UY01_PARME|nr:polysaccharide deacetylase family protein [Paramagnetospirillum magnetotacticum]KIL97686.1 Polysaccharide deacetylase family protein [Paramagnetospirillum magnetotacticum MS-1]